MAPSKNDSELKSKWPDAFDLRGSNLPCRLEGEVADLVVLGTVPPEIDGTFYRVCLVLLRGDESSRSTLLTSFFCKGHD